MEASTQSKQPEPSSPAHAQSGGSRVERAQSKPETRAYTVQFRTTSGCWEDIATVDLPLRSRRQGAIMEAYRKANAEGLTLRPEAGRPLRVLDADSAELVTLQTKPRPPVEDTFEIVAYVERPPEE